MKITFVLGSFSFSGGVRVVAEYAKRLQARGHDVMVVGRPETRFTLRRRFQYFLKQKRWMAQNPLGSHLDSTGVPCRRLERRRPVVESDVPDADVIIATWWETAHWISHFGPAKGQKVYFIQHHEADPTWFSPSLVDNAEASYRLDMHHITISRWLVDLLREKYGRPGATLILNSVDSEWFQAPPREKQPQPTVGMLYADMPFKGCDISLRALEIVRRELPDVKLIAFGIQPVAPLMPLPPGSEFHLKPAQAAIPGLYARCDAWLCGSRAEGFHLPPLEAMSCRCPVVSTRVGGPIDIIEDGVNGYLAPVEDAEALADRLLRVLRLDGPSWRRMSDEAHRTAISYTWDDATDLFEAQLQALVAGRSATAGS